MSVLPALQSADATSVKRCGSFRCGCSKHPELPFLILIVEIGDAGIVERPKGLADRAVNQVAGAAGVEVVENYGAFRDRLRVGAYIEEFLAVVGKREIGSGRAGDFLYGPPAYDDFAGSADIRDGGGHLKASDCGLRSGLLLGGIVGVFFALVNDAGK